MIRKIFLAVFIIFGCSVFLQAQKNKVIAVSQLIETGKFDEAKKAIEEAIDDDKTRHWPRTWYTKGLLCQTAYDKGIKSNNKKQYELYPDQLYVAFESYEKAHKMDKRGRIDSQLAPQYVLLANDFQKLGERSFNSKKYKDACKAFEQSIEIYKSSILSAEVDSNLIYNTALASFECNDWDKTIKYLEQLNKDRYSSNVSHLLYSVYIEKSDTLSAVDELMKGIKLYEDNETLILVLADLLFQLDQTERVIALLDSVSVYKPENYTFPYTKGLIFQKTEQYEDAIQAYEVALELAPDETKLYKYIGMCYFNIGAGLADNARTIINNSAFLAEKEKSAAAYKSAIKWFEKAKDKDPYDQEVTSKLYQLYKIVGVTDKI